MRPLNAYYRRMAYQILKDIHGIETHSPEGDDRLKRITISPSGSNSTAS
jgi:predicted RNA-binding protein Jag